MLQGGDWLTPHWAGTPRLDNPPLFLWLVAVSFAGLGITNYAAILPSALAGVLGVLVLHRLALALGLDRFGAWCAAFVLLTTQYFVKYARHAMFDVFLTLLFLLALLAYRRALAGRPAAWLWAGACTGLGVLVKSVMGFFPLAVIALHLVWTRRARELTRPWFLAAAAVALVLGLWWFALQLAAQPGLLAREYRFLIWERMVLGPGPGAWWQRLDYLAGLARIYWPWAPAALWGAWLCARSAWARDGRRGAVPAPAPDAARLILLWPALVVGVMSLANEKKLWYLMSVFPALALLSAVALASWIRDERARRRAMSGGFALLALAALVVNLTPLRIARDRRPDLQAMALAARSLVPAGQRVLNLDAGYYSVNPQFLFYSDRSLTEPLADPAAVRRGLDAGRHALLTPAGYAAVAGADSSRYPIVVRSGGWVLARAAPRPAVPLAPLDPFR